MKLGFALALIALTGCQTMREHPRTTMFVASSIALSAGVALAGRRDGTPEPRMSTPAVNCAQVSCK